MNEKGVEITGEGIVIGRQTPMFSDREQFLRQVKAIRIIQEMHDDMHENGIVTEQMSDFEKASACAGYLKINIGCHPSPRPHSKEPGRLQAYDSIYNCVTKDMADCGPRAAVLTILLHLEGIKAQTIPVSRANGDGHVMVRAILDGDEYWLDWQHNIAVRKPEEWKKSNGWVLQNKVKNMLF